MTSNNLQVPKHSELFSYVCSSIQDEEVFHFMGFELLHRLNIVQLQNDLISIKEDVLRTRGAGVDTERLKKLLNDYTTAVQNYNYVHLQRRLDHHTAERRKQRLKRNFISMTTSYRHSRPFETHYYYLHSNAHPTPDVLRDKLRRWLPSRLSYSAQERLHRNKEYEEGQPPIEISPFVDKIVRLCMAILAILILVLPMCFMSLWPSKTNNLITAALFMVIFACGMSFGINGTNLETLVATATYSAVLVVFVGTNS
ncbi:hypothetical protein BKA56DRAFT_679066 [Ilyonectria sp. MPI-CAGE-AT-0026]|nr:hypothetical protein BKA56DRAFT_679066 [Ilyonectria sp. MPI-CAGE-AT-0026]